MTPRERVEAVARVAWGVPHVRVEVFPDSRHPARIVASAMVYARDVDGIPTGSPCATAWDATGSAALMRLADQIVAEAAGPAVRTRAQADALAAEARILEGLARCLARAVPCREGVARCTSTHTAREFCPVATRQPWWRPAGARGRACRDPHRRSTVCPACIPLDTRPAL